MHMVLNNPYFVVVKQFCDEYHWGEFRWFEKDSTRAQFEERQTDAETKLAELRSELEKLGKALPAIEENKEEEEESDEEASQNEDQDLQQTLARVKIEEQILRVEEIVSLYKVKRLILYFFLKKTNRFDLIFRMVFILWI